MFLCTATTSLCPSIRAVGFFSFPVIAHWLFSLRRSYSHDMTMAMRHGRDLHHLRRASNSSTFFSQFSMPLPRTIVGLYIVETTSLIFIGFEWQRELTSNWPIGRQSTAVCTTRLRSTWSRDICRRGLPPVLPFGRVFDHRRLVPCSPAMPILHCRRLLSQKSARRCLCCSGQ